MTGGRAVRRTTACRCARTRCASSRPWTTAAWGRSPDWRTSPGSSRRWLADRFRRDLPHSTGDDRVAPRSGGGRSGDLDLVAGPHHVDALARTVLGRVDHVQPQVRGDVRATAGAGEKLAAVVLHVREPVDVELEHRGCVLHAQAVTRAQV